MRREGYHFEIWQGGVMVVEGSGPDLDEVGREMVRYAVQYVQDGPITIKGSPQLHPPGTTRRSSVENGRNMKAEIRPNPGAKFDEEGCVDTDEVVGEGTFHVEQMDANCYWARLDLADGRAIVMHFHSESPISLRAEWD